MGFHHLAFAAKDVAATHAFYSGPMGFALVKVEVARCGKNGWAKHYFYDTGGDGLIAFWDLHDPDLGDDWSPAIATGLGLPPWTNHVAFAARDLSDIEARKKRWLEHGVDVVEIDHRWCYSVYATDPNGILVEFCVTTQEFSDADREEAARLLADPAPALATPPRVIVHKASEYQGTS